MHYPKPFKKLIENFSALPSVGPKMAERLVLYLFKQDKTKLQEFSENLLAIQNLSSCRKCFNVSEGELCEICKNSNRDQKIICVVEEPLDIISIERTSAFQGLYYVLGGVIFGNSAQDIKIKELVSRVKNEGISEVIFATNPTTEGDATALYLKKELADFPNLKLTRLARGLATGGDIEYADEITLNSALTNRREMK